MIRSENGQSLILFALATSLFSVAAVLSIMALNNNQLDKYTRTKSLLEGYTVMQSFGVIVQRAYDLSQTLGGAPCTAGTRPVKPASSVRFCLPNANPQVCLNGYCLTEIFSASNDKNEPVLEARLTRQESFFAKLNIQPILKLFSSEAHAQRVYQRQNAPSAAATNNSIRVVTCPGGGLCKRCDNSSLSCITLKVCPLAPATCTATQYWTQRYGIRVN